MMGWWLLYVIFIYVLAALIPGGSLVFEITVLLVAGVASTLFVLINITILPAEGATS